VAAKAGDQAAKYSMAAAEMAKTYLAAKRSGGNVVKASKKAARRRKLAGRWESNDNERNMKNIQPLISVYRNLKISHEKLSSEENLM
jgi:hypothetical protein